MVALANEKRKCGVLEIPLTQGQVALIDDSDAMIVGHLGWYAYWSTTAKKFYAVRTETLASGIRRQAYMHRMILGVTDPAVLVDHINNAGLDNRRSNLRLCLPYQNQSNRKCGYGKSQFKGVYWDSRCNKWFAQIKAKGRQIYLGICESEIEAATRYDSSALQYHGEFARLNFNQQQETNSGNSNADIAQVNEVCAIGGSGAQNLPV